PSTKTDLTIKGDERFTDRDFLSVKFSTFWGTSVNHPNLFHSAGDEFAAGSGTGLDYSGTANYTRTISPNTVLVIMAGDTLGSYKNDNLLNTTYKGLSPVTTLGMPSYIADSGYNAFPQTYLAQGYLGVGGQGWANPTAGYETRHLLGSLTHVAGKHELKFGAEMRIHHLDMLFNGEPAGVMNFGQFGSAQQEGYGGGAGGGDAMATFLMGDNDGWGGYEIPLRPATADKQTSMYVQDNWKVTPRLTLDLGLRYDIQFPRTERYNRMSYFDPNAPPPPQIANVPGEPDLHGAFEFAGVGGNGRTVSPVYWGEIQPRFGFAYRLTKNTSVRGGYGIYYDQSMTGTVGLGVTTFNGFSVTTNNVNWENGNLAAPASFMRNPYPQGILQPLGAAYGPGLYLGSTFTAPIPSWNRIPQEQSWNFDVQHQLPASMLLDVAYVGKKGTHLYGGPSALDYLPPNYAAAFRANPGAANAQVPNPFYGYISGEGPTAAQWSLWLPYPQYVNGNSAAIYGSANPDADSIYHALQIKLEKRFSSGLQFLTSYVWSKSIDDASLIGGGTSFLGGTVSLQDPNNFRGERSLSEFNIPQVFQFTAVYDLPFGRGKQFGSSMNRWIDLFVGGWHLNGTYRLDDGQPLMLTLNSSVNLPTYGPQRPEMLGTLQQNPGVNINAYFANPQVIGTPAPYMDGDEGRTDPHLRSPGANTLNASMFKDFPLGFREGARLEIRAEFMNVLNHPVFGAPNTTFGNPLFGVITTQANQPRTGQLGLKLYF
ncbi:MAG: TonB-dependent receptor, partial [Acidobacteriia bacterium]|nr:TonB-dependent receptor [Terriglobia bacterium]